MNSYPSWGLYPHAKEQRFLAFNPGRPVLPTPCLPRGLGRSYGDSCLISNGTLLSSQWIDHFCGLDHSTGVVEVEAGVTLGDLLKHLGPQGWFPPVTPGTKYVTVGGAIANDVHGKNHHVAGTFGRHVLSLDLLRSDGQVWSCSRAENPDLFRATIGGLGLTGFILRVRVQMLRVQGPMIEQETIAFSNLERFFELTEESTAWPYTVAWVGSPHASGDVHGIFIRGRHSSAPTRYEGEWASDVKKKNIPLMAPGFLVNRLSVAALNTAYYGLHRLRQGISQVHFDPFFYPLDSILNWNRLYGRRGFLQYQFVVPEDVQGRKALRGIFTRLSRAPVGSFLSVLKTFGDFEPEGYLSFPRRGITLAMDFPITGPGLFELLNDCDQLVLSSGGGLYPAKDSRMPPAIFKASFPRLNEFKKWLDPALTSDFWRRVQ